NDHVQWKIDALPERALNRVDNCPLAISDRNHNTGSDGKILGGSRHDLELRLEPRAYAFQMLGRNLLHLDLVLAILGVNVIELLRPRRPRVRHRGRIERFRNSDDGMPFRKAKAQIVQGSPTVSRR